MPRTARCKTQPQGCLLCTRPHSLSPADMRCSSKSPKNSAFGFFGGRCKEPTFPVGHAPREGTAFTSVFADSFGSNPALLVFYIILGGLVFCSPYMPIHGKCRRWEGCSMGRECVLPKLGSYSLMNLLVRNFTVRAAGGERGR